MLEQGMEGSIRAIVVDEPLQIAILAAGETQELAIRACGVAINSPTDQSQEVRLSLFEASVKDSASFVKADRMPQEGREASEEPRADEDVLHQARAGKLQTFGLPRTIGHPPAGRKKDPGRRTQQATGIAGATAPAWQDGVAWPR
jgi:hypothetical protein